eukprot:c23235_g1_i5 orf=140-451(+)
MEHSCRFWRCSCLQSKKTGKKGDIRVTVAANVQAFLLRFGAYSSCLPSMTLLDSGGASGVSKTSSHCVWCNTRLASLTRRDTNAPSGKAPANIPNSSKRTVDM